MTNTAKTTLIMSYRQETDSDNGVSAGLYHRTKEGAEAAAMPGASVLETSPGTIWRVKVAA